MEAAGSPPLLPCTIRVRQLRNFGIFGASISFSEMQVTDSKACGSLRLPPPPPTLSPDPITLSPSSRGTACGSFSYLNPKNRSRVQRHSHRTRRARARRLHRPRILCRLPHPAPAPNLLGVQRAFFGAHSYGSIDRPRGECFHTNWTGRCGHVSSTTYTA